MCESIELPSLPRMLPCMRAVSVRKTACDDGSSFFQTSVALVTLLWERPLGCQRPFGDALFEAALDAGLDTFDTARAYGDSERALGAFLRARGARVRVVTKGGMGEGWKPDGRARALRGDLDASLEALGVP